MSKLRHMTSAYESGNVPEIQVHHRLRIAREFAHLEQQQLADRIGISRNSVSSAELGRTKPRKITLNAWALATGVPVTWLITGQTPGRPGDGPGGGLRDIPDHGTADYRAVIVPFPARQIDGAVA